MQNLDLDVRCCLHLIYRRSGKFLLGYIHMNFIQHFFELKITPTVEPMIVASHLFCSLPLRMNFLLKNLFIFKSYIIFSPTFTWNKKGQITLRVCKITTICCKSLWINTFQSVDQHEMMLFKHNIWKQTVPRSTLCTSVWHGDHVFAHIFLNTLNGWMYLSSM